MILYIPTARCGRGVDHEFEGEIKTMRLVCYIFVLGTLLLAGGCGADETAWVSGTVIFDGKAVPDGALRFFPAKGTPGNGAGAEIVDGQYKITPEFAKKKGMLAGSYRISVVASRKTGKMFPNPDGKGMMEQEKMYIPQRYNRQTQLHTDIKPGGNEHDLVLKR